MSGLSGSRSQTRREKPHEVTLDLSFEQAVELPDKQPTFSESFRDGQCKRIYKSSEPDHYFHLEYQLLPGDCEGGGVVSKTDVVTFGVVSKVFTEDDAKVVKCWEENGLNHYGWRHRHTFKVNKEFLMKFYSHVLEVKVWSSRSKVSTRAKYNRPKAFRLPAPTRSSQPVLEGSGAIGLSPTSRPQRFTVVNHHHAKARRKKQPSKITVVLREDEGGEEEDEEEEEEEEYHQVPEPATSKAVVVHETSAEKEEEKSDEVKFAPAGGDMSLAVVPSSSVLQGLSRRRQRQLEAEAAERARMEREGMATLRLKMSDLFAKHTAISTKLTEGAGDLQGWELGVSLEGPLMPESLRRELNPMTITIVKAREIPPLPSDQRERCEDVYVRYQFHDQPPHCTPGHCHAPSVSWADYHVILLGTIDRELLTEYARGPPLTMELHDRDRRIRKELDPSVFGQEDKDEVLGTHAFGSGLAKPLQGELQPRDPYGVVRLDISGMLEGQRVMEFTVPVTSGPCGPPDGGGEGVLGGESFAPLPPGDYLHFQTELTVVIELTFPFTLVHTLTPSPSSKSSPTRAPSKQKSSLPRPSPRPHSRAVPKCPFGRLVYIIASESEPLVQKVISLVNIINTNTLGLQDLPPDLLQTALSTYKLTHSQMCDVECDVVTGFHVEDWEQHVLVLEGVCEGGLGKVWAEGPRNPAQVEGLLKVFYNSSLSFSHRLYGSLDVDLPRIQLYQPVSALAQQPLLYVQGSIPASCFRALMCLNELNLVTEMADIVRNNLLPSAEEVAALSLQFAVPAGMDVTSEGKNSPAIGEDRPTTPQLVHRRSHMLREPLDRNNPHYLAQLKERQGKPAPDFIKKNVLLNRETSECNRERRRAKRMRSLSESVIPMIRTEEEEKEAVLVHRYSSQTLNSTELAKAKLRHWLAGDPSHRYTYCQHYHSMTVVPVDVEAEERAKRLSATQRWRTRDGFRYPGVPSALESNAHPQRPGSARCEELKEPFQDLSLHAATMKPTVQRMHFNSKDRALDFERYQPPPSTLGTPPPITIHLGGESRSKELQQLLDERQDDWRSKVIVTDTHFHTHRKGVRTEATRSGPRAATQLDRLRGLLKDPPQKLSLMLMEETPALNVVHNPSVDNRLNILTVEREGEREGLSGGYHPGPLKGRSLKLDSNVIPVSNERTGSISPNTHTCDFRLFYHQPSVLARRPVLPLSEGEQRKLLSKDAAAVMARDVDAARLKRKQMREMQTKGEGVYFGNSGSSLFGEAAGLPAPASSQLRKPEYDDVAPSVSKTKRVNFSDVVCSKSVGMAHTQHHLCALEHVQQ